MPSFSRSSNSVLIRILALSLTLSVLRVISERSTARPLWWWVLARFLAYVSFVMRDVMNVEAVRSISLSRAAFTRKSSLSSFCRDVACSWAAARRSVGVDGSGAMPRRTAMARASVPDAIVYAPTGDGSSNVYSLSGC